ncbi:pantothenate kinase [Ancylothrix sp. C2]|uniref:pantothenate kinase n=1 Tax=Ancylothrix sp. D3o TaxID=2953691 RepID=UPI0021BA8966|nr:pantothenate kinase [Ancylothrix sp. D3o]MCT7952078.1 pantothenate kinase [Ancylothrix sp. D3o]
MNQTTKDKHYWLALMVGNSRLHWACFCDRHLLASCDTPHPPAPQLFATEFSFSAWQPQFNTETIPSFATNLTDQPPVVVASVVPDLLKPWQSYPNARILTLADVPMVGIYPTLGIDRALAVWGAGNLLGWPVLVIDTGTALTFTAANSNKTLKGGAILPGLGLQFQSLSQKTAALPLIEISSNPTLPPRWALNTEDAISSGILYTLLAGIHNFITDWLQQFPSSSIALTGGDRQILGYYLKQLFPDISAPLIIDKNLIFWGIRDLALSQM